MGPKPNWLQAALKLGGGFMSRGAREKETHYKLKINQICLKIVIFGVADYRSSFRFKKSQNGFNMAVKVYKN